MKKQVNEHPTEITYMYRGDNQIYKFKKKTKRHKNHYCHFIIGYAIFVSTIKS